MNDLVSLIKKNEFGMAKRYLSRELSTNPDDVYLLTQMANVLWNLRKDEEALLYVDKAQAKNSHDSLMLFTKGRVLWSLNRYAESVATWDKLLSLKLADIAERGWGERWARSVVNDARFYKADCLYCLHHVEEAKMLMEEHLSNRRKGQNSDFTIKEARELLRVLTYSRGDDRSFDEDESGWASAKQWAQIENMMKRKKGDKRSLVAYLKKKSREFSKEYYLKLLLAEHLIDQKKYQESLKYASDAYRQEPTDALVLYDYANALYNNGMCDEAEHVLEVIVHTDINQIAYGEHGEGLRWAKKLQRDSQKLLALCQNHYRQSF